MEEQKTYINGVFINEHTFNDGGQLLKLSIPDDKIDAFAAQLKAASSNGWARLVVAKMRAPKLSQTTGKPIATHSLYVDTWQPKGSPAQVQPAPTTRKYQSPIDDKDVPSAAKAGPEDTVPF